MHGHRALTRGARAVVWALAAGGPIACLLACSLIACSTVDRGPIDECQDDVDCGLGSVCSLQQGNICVPESLPPRTALGFDIRDGDVRIELQGCDEPQVSLELGGSALRIQKRSSLVRNFEVSSQRIRRLLTCDTGTCTGECDADALTCTEPIDAKLGLSTSSRLYLQDPSLPARDFVAMPGMDGEPPVPVPFTWPNYSTLADPRAHAALRLRVDPVADASRASYLRVLADEAGESLMATSLDQCQRAIIGDEGTIRTIGQTWIDGATVEFFFNEAIASSGTVIGSRPVCSVDEDCPLGWACNEQGRCGLDLRGVSAASSNNPSVLDGRLSHAFLYTYCEDVEDGESYTRSFTVRLTPPSQDLLSQAPLGYPTVIYELEQEFPHVAPGGLTATTLAKGLCLPEWQPPESIGFSVIGEPVALTETPLGVYACCSTECLPSPEPGVEPIPPTPIASCSQFERVRFETRWFNDLDAWSFANCLETATYSDGSSGRYAREVMECAAEGCSALLTLGEADETARNYTVSIHQPVGSVFRSQRFNVSLTPETTEFPPFELQPRVLVRGSIECTTSNCNAQNAVFAAERLRTEDDDSDLPGPFYFDARADTNGNFLLPIDPGLYVVTAFPAIGQPGGPAPFQILDLREGSELLTQVGGVPQAILSQPFQLDNGVLVRVQLREFPVSTSVTPLDIGSWKYQADFPDDIDLNDPLTCLGSTRGCDIRRVRPTDAPVSLSISGRLQFTARRRGDDSCPG